MRRASSSEGLPLVAGDDRSGWLTARAADPLGQKSIHVDESFERGWRGAGAAGVGRPQRAKGCEQAQGPKASHADSAQASGSAERTAPHVSRSSYPPRLGLADPLLSLLRDRPENRNRTQFGGRNFSLRSNAIPVPRVRKNATMGK